MALLHLSRPAYELCIQGDWKEAETVITEEMTHSSNRSNNSLASRALVRARLQDWNGAYDDAQQVRFCCVLHMLVFSRVKSLKVQLSVDGYIAKAIALVGQGESQAGIRAFDLTFLHCSLKEIPFLFLIRVRALYATYLRPLSYRFI
jgi:hypothetical protein